MTSIRVERGALRMRLRAWGIAYAPAAVLAVLLPKCPLCIAAQLALLGVTIPLPSYARAIAIGSSAVIGTAFLILRATRRKRLHCCACRAGS